MIHKSCLILNADYTPMGIIDWKKAMVWSFRYGNNGFGRIEIIEYHETDIVITSSGPIKIPSIIKTNRYFKILNKRVNFSRKNVFIRDDFTCQYCNNKFPITKLTYDHVIPKSLWKLNSSPTCWTNIVTACIQCNFKKSNKTPSQANMPLQKEPFVPQKSMKYLPLAHQLNTILKDFPKEWNAYVGDMVTNADL
jgi:hypothetical protein